MNSLHKIVLVVFTSLILVGCSGDAKMDADKLLAKTMDAHGAYGFYGKEIGFDFRDRSYTLYRDSSYFQYTRLKDSVEDRLHSKNGFSRYINGEQISVVDSMVTKYSSSVNSVLYFFQLPLVLYDGAVQKEYLGTTSIRDKDYHRLRITFQQEGGGGDYEDEFRYWINTETFEIDYLAYSYLTDGGGVRFREAFNKNHIEGILFQDYRNYKPDGKETPLDSLPVLFEKESIELLSTIENRNIRFTGQD